MIIGIDPGLTGAYAILSGGRVTTHPLPIRQYTRGRGSSKAIDADALLGALRDIFAFHTPFCVLELVGGISGQGAHRAFNFGRGVGVIEAALQICGARVVYVAPQVWRAKLGVRAAPGDKNSKAASRRVASALFPASAADWARAKDDGLAEAALIAEYGNRFLRVSP